MTGITFEIRVEGHVDPEAIDHLAEVTRSEASANTVLSCEVVDQAALLGLLMQLRAQGLLVIEVRRREGPERPSAEDTGDAGDASS